MEHLESKDLIELEEISCNNQLEGSPRKSIATSSVSSGDTAVVEITTSPGNLECRNKIRGCGIELPTMYMEYHSKYICPFREIENGIMYGTFNKDLILEDYKCFAKYKEAHLCIRKNGMDFKIKGQNLGVSQVLVLEYLDSNEEHKGAYQHFYRHNNFSHNLSHLPAEYFEEGKLMWKLKEVKEE